MLFLFWLALTALYIFILRLLVPRVALPGSAPATWRERAIVGTYYLIGFSWWLEPSEPSAEAFTVGFLLYGCGMALAIWAMHVNPHFKAKIEAPPEVIRAGPYGLLRHPGYAGFIAQGAGSVLMLGHRVGLIPLAIYAAALCWRARREHKLLKSL